mgnify:CR=1 FL=1
MNRTIERQRYLIDFTIASLARRRGRNLGLFAVYTLLVFVLASASLLGYGLRKEARTVLAASPEILVQHLLAGRHDLIPESHLAALRDIRGIAAAEGRLWGYYYDAGMRANYTLMVPSDRTIEPGTAIIGSAIARLRNLGEGDAVHFLSPKAKMFRFGIAGTLPSESELVAADVVLVSEADFRAFFGFPAGMVTDIAVSVRNPKEVATVSAKISRLIVDARVVTRDDILRSYESLFDWRQGMITVLLAGAVLAFVILAWDKAAGLSAEERREIGILKAIGWETSDVIAVKFWEGGLVSLGAFLVAYTLAYLHVFHFGGALFAPALKGWATLYPDFRMVPEISGQQIATIFFLTVVPYTLATIVPVWRAAIIDPDTVMR